MFAAFCGCCLAVAMQAQQARYELVWEDNFNGPTFDEQYWSKIPRGGVDWNRHMSDADFLYEVKDGNLVLRGMVNDGKVPQDTARYITGGLYTKGKFNIGYGKVEICAKLGRAQGAWPAFWMLPEKGEWPKGGEIDIMEHLSHDTIAYQTVHSYYTYVLKQENNPPHGALVPSTATATTLIPWKSCRTVWCSPSTDKRRWLIPASKRTSRGSIPSAHLTTCW